MRLRTAALVLFLLATPAFGAELTGRVVAVSDGDTLTLLTVQRNQVRIRLAAIDAPEHDQPYGNRAKQALSALVFARDVNIAVVDHDRYGRTVGRVQVGEIDVNAQLLREGAAWVFTRYNDDPNLVTIEAEARAAKRGLWALPKDQQVPPWEWRRVARAERRTPPAATETQEWAVSGLFRRAAATLLGWFGYDVR